MSEHPQTITIVYSDYETPEGEKALFGAVRRAVTKMGALDADALADSLSTFCRQLGGVFEQMTTAIGRYDLERLEVTVEVTARGEVRLIGSAGADVRGGLKLVFARRSGKPE